MIERSFVQQKIQEFNIRELIFERLKSAGVSEVEIQKTPLGERIIIYGLYPGKLVGRGGKNIKELTQVLKEKYKLENPQIEVKEEPNPWLNARIVAERIATSLERYGVNRFRAIIHKVMGIVMKNGAKGIEVRISGKVPSDRARTWRFFTGYLKKCGNPAKTIVRSAKTTALLKIGVVGVKVKIMPPEVLLPDHVIINEITKEELDEIAKEIKEEVKDEETAKKKTKKTTKKKTTKKTAKRKTKKTTTRKKTTKKTTKKKK